jgi:hypothetical protein
VTKTHFSPNSQNLIACHRFVNARTRKTAEPSRVTCLDCKSTDRYAKAAAADQDRREAAFKAQTPRQFEEPWGKGRIVCRKCQGDLFRDNGRSLDHYRYVCAECGETTLRLTETGMSA